MFNFILFGSLLLCPVFSLYSSSDVVELTASTFDRVLSSDGVWIVEFYAPWCGHCQQLAPEWKKAASALKGVVQIAAVNADEHNSLSSQYNIKGFPTILVFSPNKRASPITYSGGRTASEIVKQALTYASQLVNSRIGGSGSSGKSTGDDVVELTDANFDDLVLNSDEHWLIEFFAPWCGHCKTLKPHWDKAATELKGVMKLGAVDATVHNSLSSKYGIQGFPTIKFFPAGMKSGDSEDYDGGRTSEDIIRWAQGKADASVSAPKAVEVTSPDVFSEACEKHPICVISVLPTLYDCQTECREEYLALINTLAEQNKKQKWGWLWTEALKQPDMEKTFDIGGSGYPALVAVHGKKKMRAPLRGPFSKDGIHDLIRSLLHGDANLPLYPIPKIPTIEKTTAWDGKDAPPIEEEELDPEFKTEL